MKQTGTQIVVLMMIFFMAVCAYAGDLEPPAGDPASTMHTLEDIYDAVTTRGVVETGQTVCYDAAGSVIDCTGTGQDGELQKGVAIPNPRFTDNLDGTVTDNFTSLIWLKNANAFGAKNWTTALTDCNGLADGTAGLSDGSSAGAWRLPNRFELESLNNLAYYNPCISNTAGTAKWTAGDPFTNVQGGYYWSGTTYAHGTDRAWTVYMSSGIVSGFDKTNSSYVWPVRGGND